MSAAVIHPCWVPTDDGAMAAAWFWPPAYRTVGSTAVVIVPGIALEDRTWAVGVRPLASALAVAGHATLSLHLEGCGPSTSLRDPATAFDTWTRGVRAALRHVGLAGFRRVVVIGIRAGALPLVLGLTGETDGDSPELPTVSGSVLWAPVWDGRRYVRELTMLSQAAAERNDTDEADDVLVVGTFPLDRRMLDSLRPARITSLDSTSGLGALAGGRMLVLDDPERFDEAGIEALTAAGARVERSPSSEVQPWLHAASELAHTPTGDIDAVVAWVTSVSSEAGASGSAPPAVQPVGEVEFVHVHHGVEISERFVSFGQPRLAGVLARPVGGPRPEDHPAWLLISSVQPGLAFQDLARDEAAAGRASLRFDFTSSGLSQRRRRQTWGELNSMTSPDDVRAAKDWLCSQGYPGVVLVGFCAGAQAALMMGHEQGLAAVVGVNAQAYVGRGAWRTDDGGPLFRLQRWIDRFDRRMFVSRARLVWAIRYSRWSPSLRGLRHQVRSTKVFLPYDDVDPGYRFVRRNFDRHLREAAAAGRLRIEEYPKLGHILDGYASRQRLIDDVRTFGNEVRA